MQTITRAEAYEQFPLLPSFSYDEPSDTDLVSFPDPVRTEILEISAAHSAEDRFAQLAAVLTTLTQQVGAEALLFMGASETPWRYQPNPFEPAKAADAFLKARQLSKTFNGGVLLQRSELPQWVPQLLWLIVSNASFPELYFIDPDQQLLGTFCRYGNLHLYLLQATADEPFNRWLRTEPVRLITDTGCSDQGDGVQSGRQTVVD
ncbi:MAG: hypothetical protein EOP52_09355 [Sphingobacteriales bacterium]|nr:MAG: hypothetical protein EOP52_09355 [Sphingobacteriales bacterium]